MSKFDAPSKTQVRFAIVEEAALIASVLHQAFAEYESLYTPEAFTATALTADRIQERWSEGPVWVAQRSTALSARLLPSSKTILYIYAAWPFCQPGRGKGVGRLLLEHVERFADTKGARRMFLCTTPFLLQAIRLYEHYGFQRITDRPLELFGTPLFTMERIVRP